jgi:hypothetical protein
VQIIIKKYEHYNRSLGKYITSKAQYDNEMARQGMVSYDEGKILAEKARKEKIKPYTISQKAQEIINTAKRSADRRGKVKLSDKTIDAMKDLGVSFNLDHCPEHYKDKGGFNAI